MAQHSGLVRLFLVRHGETDHNVARRIQGPLLDDPLNARGREQAAALQARFIAERAGGARVAAVYASPMRRAWETAEAVARAVDIEAVERFEPMIEFSWGVYLGKQEHDIRDAMVEIHRRWDAGELDHAPPEGESPVTAWARASAGLRRLFARHPKDDVVVVAHGRINKVVIAALVDQDLRRMDAHPQGNTSVTLLEQDPHAAFDAPWRSHYVNSKHHLGALDDVPGTAAEGEPPLV